MTVSLPVSVDDIMSPEELDIAIKFLKRIERPGPPIRPNHLGSLGFQNSLEASKVSMDHPIYPVEPGSEDGEAIMVLTKMLVRAKEEMQNFYGVEMDLVQASHTSINPGTGIGLHSDTTNMDGSPMREDGVPEEMEWSAVFYLNTSGVDYEGGELYFPNQDFTYVPKAGSLVHFLGDFDHIHKVNDITSGTRMSIAIFFGKKGNVSGEQFFY